ncbi:MAG: anti-sigma factor antagonist [Lachnospiraceae bacterium]|nr:anti-sigma factor antagonist [Lachnospiraceae bacterium]
MDMLELKENRLVVRLPEELDHHRTEEIRCRIDQTVKSKPVDEVEFDFSRTAFMDSAGIGMLIGRYKIMKVLGGRICLTHMNRQIQRILSLSGIQKFMQLEREESI